MALDTYPGQPPLKPAGNSPARDGLPDREPACCTSDDRSRSLMLTQLDGITEGFPLTWLYRWRWRNHATRERLVLTLTEHEIEVRGKNLSTIPALLF